LAKSSACGYSSELDDEHRMFYRAPVGDDCLGGGDLRACRYLYQGHRGRRQVEDPLVLRCQFVQTLLSNRSLPVDIYAHGAVEPKITCAVRTHLRQQGSERF
jgi:hypothetical protein